VEAETISSASTRNQWPRTLRGLNSAFSFLTYLPTIAIAAIVLGDLKYAFFQSLDLYPNRLWWLLHLQRFYLVQFITLDVLAIATLVFVISVNRLTNRFQTATASAIERFIASGTGH
jgi:hypothetical protein